ncbi:hypothetical protein [Robertkochia aurantiaca]|uniref:hypothetical protein n=1 Tax=Robertkochia aurantiaca TaxID=2873700 RepID=UPI001CD01938|nr:hypothetical protein [Robertkochia sp. 3YJGBD-33]
MRTSGIYFLCIALISCLLSCDSDDDSGSFETLEFSSEFSTERIEFFEGGSCSVPFRFLNVEEGSGFDGEVGEFEIILSFCFDPGTMEFRNVEGIIIDADGNEIYFEGEGEIYTFEDDFYELEYFETWDITGGSGIYNNASGFFDILAEVDSDSNITDHDWTGEIILP